MMNDYELLLTFVLPQRAYIAKSVLESEGIEVIIKDDIASQVNNFYSNALGGVKLFVKKEDYGKAYTLLLNGGFFEDGKESNHKLLLKFDKFSSKLPIIGNLILEFRLIIIIALIVLIILFLLLYFGGGDYINY